MANTKPKRKPKTTTTTTTTKTEHDIFGIDTKSMPNSGNSKTYIFWNVTDEYYDAIHDITGKNRANLKRFFEVCYDNRVAIGKMLSRKK